MKHWKLSSHVLNLFLCAAATCTLVTGFTHSLSAQTERPLPDSLPVTTKSPEALKLYQGGLVKLENLHGPEAMQDFRHAIQLDPDFAMANIMMSFESVDQTVDPAEKVAARKRAIATRMKVSPDERLVIDWLSNSSEGRIIPAIQAMNEVLARYPNDKYLAWLGAVWVENQQQIRRAIPMFEHAIQLNPDFAPPLNELGYCYARVREFDKAFSTMQRYIELLPNESNPQDSYAEILRMAGHFDEALEHYRASLKIDSKFVSSQLGIADTYALMGDEARARAEYELAIQNAGSRTESAMWRLQSATTYVREQNRAGADIAFRRAAEQSHREALAAPEAEAYRMMAAYQTSGDQALALLNKAERVLQEKHALPQMARQQELAVILRDRVSRAAQDGNMALAKSALKRLQDLSDTTHDQVVRIAYDGSAGAMLVKEGQYREALVHLEEDSRNPLTMKLMVTAYEKTGAQSAADEMSAILSQWNEPTLEQALVSPGFRDRQPKSAASSQR